VVRRFDLGWFYCVWGGVLVLFCVVVWCGCLWGALLCCGLWFFWDGILIVCGSVMFCRFGFIGVLRWVFGFGVVV